MGLGGHDLRPLRLRPGDRELPHHLRSPHRRHTAPDDADRIRFVDEAGARTHLPPLYEQVRRTVPGMFARSDDWWALRHFADHEWMQEGSGPRRTVVAFRPSTGGPVDGPVDGPVEGQVEGAVGYATYRMKSGWDDNDLPTGKLAVIEVIAVDDRAEHSLWSFLSNIDLFPSVEVDTGSPDVPLPWWAENFRSVGRTVNDGIWLRLLDVAAALESRRYQVADRLVFEIVDDHRPEVGGRFELVVDEGTGRGRCARTDAAAETSMTAPGLGSLYLGGIDPAAVRAGGLINGDDDMIDRLRQLFVWPGRVHCGEIF